MDNRIEAQISIQASLNRVWELVTQPGWWVPTATEAAIDRTLGHQTVRETEQFGRFPVELVSLDPRSYAAFRWASQFPGDELTPGKTTLVEFFVAEEPGGVTVRVVETGFQSLEASEDIRHAGFTENTEGWRLELAELRSRAEAPLVG